MTGDEFLYGKRHAPPVLKKLDDIANEVNTKLRMRGIARGMVCVQEDINSIDLTIQKRVYDATKEPDVHKRLNILIEIKFSSRTDEALREFQSVTRLHGCFTGRVEFHSLL